MRDVCCRIFAAFDCFIDSYAKELPSHLKFGHDPVPKELVENARDLDEETVNQGVKKHVLEGIDENKREAIVREIKDILNDDKDMLPSTTVGYVRFEKEAKSSDTFEKSVLMASVLKYSISCDNVSLKDSIKEIETMLTALLEEGRRLYLRIYALSMPDRKLVYFFRDYEKISVN